MVSIKRDPYYLRSSIKKKSKSSFISKIKILPDYLWPNLCIPHILFQKYLHVIFQKLKIPYKLEKSASIALLEATELYLIQLFAETNKIVIHRNKLTITTKVNNFFVIFILTIIILYKQ